MPDRVVCERVHTGVFTVVGARPTCEAQVKRKCGRGVTAADDASREAILKVGRPVSGRRDYDRDRGQQG